jgi:hypothetical protein
MSSANLKPLGIEHFRETPIMTMWAWHLDNDRPMVVADSLEESYCDRDLMMLYFRKTNTQKKTQNETILKHVDRHRNDSNLVRYGDFLVAKKRTDNG